MEIDPLWKFTRIYKTRLIIFLRMMPSVTLTHQFTSNKVIGPDRFRFINYYWTSSATARAIDVGTSAGTNIGFGGGLAQGPNVKQ